VTRENLAVVGLKAAGPLRAPPVGLFISLQGSSRRERQRRFISKISGQERRAWLLSPTHIRQNGFF
jgi:hypothetical protein